MNTEQYRPFAPSFFGPHKKLDFQHISRQEMDATSSTADVSGSVQTIRVGVGLRRAAYSCSWQASRFTGQTDGRK
jgi:hypothetical protein